jgi:hypothetical protein
MDWKIRLDGDEITMAHLQAQHTNPTAKVTRDGVNWFLESSEFALLTDHRAVREKATSIVQTVLGSPDVSLGNVYRMHYDNSNTVFRPDSP